jgi:hypothetical protein
LSLPLQRTDLSKVEDLKRQNLKRRTRGELSRPKSSSTLGAGKQMEELFALGE